MESRWPKIFFSLNSTLEFEKNFIRYWWFPLLIEPESSPFWFNGSSVFKVTSDLIFCDQHTTNFSSTWSSLLNPNFYSQHRWRSSNPPIRPRWSMDDNRIRRMSLQRKPFASGDTTSFSVQKWIPGRRVSDHHADGRLMVDWSLIKDLDRWNQSSNETLITFHCWFIQQKREKRTNLSHEQRTFEKTFRTCTTLMGEGSNHLSSTDSRPFFEDSHWIQLFRRANLQPDDEIILVDTVVFLFAKSLQKQVQRHWFIWHMIIDLHIVSRHYSIHWTSGWSLSMGVGGNCSRALSSCCLAFIGCRMDTRTLSPIRKKKSKWFVCLSRRAIRWLILSER